MNAKELVKNEILSLRRKVAAYKELYGEELEANEDKKEEVKPEKTDMEKLIETVNAMGKRIEALENPSKDNQVQFEAVDDKNEEPKKEATEEPKKESSVEDKAGTIVGTPVAPTQDKKSEAVDDPKTPTEEQPSQKEAVDEPKEEPKKEAAPEGDVKKEEETKKESDDEDEDDKEDEKKPLPPVMEKIRLSSIEIKSNANRKLSLSEVYKK